MSVMNFQIPKVLDGFGYLRTEFVRDDDVDKAERDHLAAGIRDSVTEYSTAEDEIFQLVQSKLGGLNDDALDEQESPDHLVTMGGMFIDGESSGVMRGSVTVDAAGEASEAMRRARRRKAGEEQTTSLLFPFPILPRPLPSPPPFSSPSPCPSSLTLVQSRSARRGKSPR